MKRGLLTPARRFRRAAIRALGSGLVAAALLFALTAPAAAAGRDHFGQGGTVSVHDSRTLAEVPDAWSRMQRYESGLFTLNHLTHLPPGREVTLHVLVFNHPEACGTNGIPGLSNCGGNDMAPGGPAGFVQVNGPTGTATPGGHLMLPAWISDRSITNPSGAEVILSFSIQGCGTGLPCANNLAVHNPHDDNSP
jgi:hypothetical protein